MLEDNGRTIRSRYPRFLNDGEFQRIITYCTEMAEREPGKEALWEKYALLFEFAGHLGRRSREASAVQVQDFTRPDLSQIRVRLSKSNRIEYFYVPQELARKFYNYIQKYNSQIVASGGYLFYTFNPQSKKKYLQPSTVWQKLIEVCTALGIAEYTQGKRTKHYRIGMHSLRRFGGTEIDKIGGLAAAQQLLGHSRRETTSIYLKPIAYDQQMKNLEKMSHRLAKPAEVFKDDKVIKEIVKEQIKEALKELLSN